MGVELSGWGGSGMGGSWGGVIVRDEGVGIKRDDTARMLEAYSTVDTGSVSSDPDDVISEGYVSEWVSEAKGDF